MPKVLILCAHRPNRSPSQRYRFEQYLEFLETNGFSFSYSFLLNEKDDVVFYSQGAFLKKICILLKTLFIRLKDCFRFKHYDLIFIQREAHFFGTSFFERCAFKSGAKVIFDFDDSIWKADTSPANLKWEWIKKPHKFYTNLSFAHWVIAGNVYLVNKAKTINSNTLLVPTTINTKVHIIKPELRSKSTLVIGWSGSISTVKHFEALIPVLIRLKQKYAEGISFTVMGDEHFFNSELPVKTLAWSEQTEVDVLNSFDIGIMPLPNDEWANGKCGLKGLSYMACGVATVMSAVGVNNDIIQNGVNGLLVKSDDEWFVSLSKLIEDKELRERMGLNGRKTVEQHYSVEVNKATYLKVFKDALKST